MLCQWEPYENKFKCKNCGFVVPRNTIKHTCGGAKIPGLGQRIVNFGKAAVRHIKTGLRHCTDEQKQVRYKQCSSNECGLFKKYGEGGICSHYDCGCYIRSNAKFMDKLSWADSECPEGYWGPIKENKDSDSKNGV